MSYLLDNPPATRPPAIGPAAPGRRPASVSIVIPAYNEHATIEGCLVAAATQFLPAREILVVDNLSTDGTAEAVHRVARRYPEAGIRVIRQSRVQGLVPTRNAGFAEATGDVLGRIDADTIIEPDWVAQVAASMADPSIGAVTGPVTYYDLPFRGAGRFSDDLVRRALRRMGTRYPFLYGSNMAIRADAWRAIEHEACPDHDDLFHEDIDLSVHLHDAGLPVAYARGMRASVSARRLQSSPESFRAYTGRFQRTYAAHGIQHWYLRAPQVLLQGAYWSARTLGSFAPARQAVAA